MRRFGLQLKFIIVIVILLLIIFSSITYELVRINAGSLRTDLNKRSQTFAALAVEPIGNSFLTYKDSGQIQIQTQIQQYMQLDSNITNIEVADTSGRVLYSQQLGYPAQISSDYAKTFVQISKFDSAGNISTIYTPFIESSGVHQYAVIYSISSQSLQNSIAHAIDSSLLLGFFGLLLSVVVTFGFMNWLFVAPIDLISRQALSISRGELDRQIEVKRSDEIGDLAVAVNTMTNALKNDIQKLREVDNLKSEFMMISSHNLRTPLTIIEGYMEALREEHLDKQAVKLVEIVDANTARLKVFAENMLVISQLEAGQTTGENRTLIDATDFLGEIGRQFKTIAEAKGLSAQINIAENLPKLSTQVHRLHDGLWNVLDNAIKFTQPGGVVTLSAQYQSSETRILLNISDNGIGISSDEIPKLFTKFHRSSTTKSYDYEGTGIGLYLAKLIIEEQGGQIKLSSVFEHGTKIEISLPVEAGTIEGPKQPGSG
ncbi:MAG: ATP-binding protein [Candidatus Saccharimonadia bacterium]